MVPGEIPIKQLREKGAWSPSLYSAELVTSTNWKPLSEFLNDAKPFDKGFEPGSLAYVRESEYRFARNKALHEDFALLYPRGDAVENLNPHAFVDVGLKSGDVLVSKDSNVGESAILPRQRWQNVGISAGLCRLNFKAQKDYVAAFLKYGNFRDQVVAMTPRGATLRHAGKKWLNARIPLPRQPDADSAVALVEALMHLIIEGEILMRRKSEYIRAAIDHELMAKQKSTAFEYAEPTRDELLRAGRLDAAFHSEECKRGIFYMSNYAPGVQSLEESGFRVIPGPSLEIRIIRKRIDSTDPVPGYYRLLLPKNISEFGTMLKVTYLGTPATLTELKTGDVLIGEAGFRKGRSTVLLKCNAKTTTNAHGLIARREDSDLSKAVFFRCIFDWYRSKGLVDLLAVGGSGGHLSPAYFHLLSIPNFPSAIRDRIVRAYNNGNVAVAGKSEATAYRAAALERQRKWGVAQLGEALEERRAQLRSILQKIAKGDPIDVAAELAVAV